MGMTMHFSHSFSFPGIMDVLSLAWNVAVDLCRFIVENVSPTILLWEGAFIAYFLIGLIILGIKKIKSHL